MRAATHARLIAWRVAKLSEQSSTTSAFAHERREPLAADALGERLDRHVGIDRRERAAAASTLGWPTSCGRVEDLALQVGEVDAVGVADRERAHARRGEELRDRRAEAAHADDQRVRGGEAGLRLLAELVQQQVAAVAEALRSSMSRQTTKPGAGRACVVARRLPLLRLRLRATALSPSR